MLDNISNRGSAATIDEIIDIIDIIDLEEYL